MLMMILLNSIKMNCAYYLIASNVCRVCVRRIKTMTLLHLNLNDGESGGLQLNQNRFTVQT